MKCDDMRTNVRIFPGIRKFCGEGSFIIDTSGREGRPLAVVDIVDTPRKLLDVFYFFQKVSDALSVDGVYVFVVPTEDREYASAFDFLCLVLADLTGWERLGTSSHNTLVEQQCGCRVLILRKTIVSDRLLLDNVAEIAQALALADEGSKSHAAIRCPVVCACAQPVGCRGTPPRIAQSSFSSEGEDDAGIRDADSNASLAGIREFGAGGGAVDHQSPA